MAPFLTSAAENWASVYAASPVIRTVVSFAHVAGLVGGGGCAIAADRAALVAWRSDVNERQRHVRSLPYTHRAVLVGLAAVVASGVLLALADLDAYWASTAFWTKMAFVGALLVNGAVLARAGQRVAAGDAGSWRALRITSIVSLALWFVTTLVGAALPNAL
jgi:hypothetical protein